jgi:hypothetical protein
MVPKNGGRSHGRRSLVSEEEEEENGVFFQPFTTIGLNRQPAVIYAFTTGL